MNAIGFVVLASLGIVLASCAQATRDERGGDRQGDELDQIPQHPSSQVCSGGTYHCYALLRTDTPRIMNDAAPSGLGPADLISAYKLDTSGGAGVTVAVVDAFNYPNAESDLAKYRAQYGLPPCTTANGCFKIVNQNGAASPLPGNAPAGDDWTVEAALDLDMVSAACPNCKIMLVEAQDDQGDGLFIGNDGAVTAGATNISNSWGGPEASNAATFETHFNHAGHGFFVSSGDSGNTGAQSDYPSTSELVTAVGGTSLVKSTNARGWTEGAWSSAGSSCAINFAKPSFQSSINTGCAKRAAADVSAVADPNTGVAVYNAGSGGWIVVGGTSASSPFVAGVYALYGLTGVGPAYAYSHTTNFFDVTTGSNGSCSGALCHAGAGWDGPTGIGSPNGANLGGGTCTPNCNGKTCGDDGCGGSCGTCAAGQTCNAGTCVGGGGTCSHPICSTGGALTASCDTCAGNICAVDSYCCSTAWDSICVGEVSSVCHQTCGGGSCAHPICSTGVKLSKTCDTCAGSICAQDPYCCNTRWDSQCVGEVSSICQESCN